MADDPKLPLEIPWKLASTTQPLAAGEPAQTAMSLFFFVPDTDDLTEESSSERIVFVKVTATISPASFPKNVSAVANEFLGEGVPCMHVLLDLKVRKAGSNGGTSRPYFHAAAPLNRRMIQSGVIGLDSFEGEAEAQFIGKSGSQMYESLRSHSSTTSVGASAGFGIGPFSIGGSVRNTSTGVSSDRAVSQVVDTTNRQAAEERRELISHSTKVENILTLLNAKYVGTPHLSFSLSPQPLYTLSVDPSDPNLWFQQLLARRSSGIEGIQEFTAVILVPKNEDFCVNARLRRVCLLDKPPGPLTFDERFTGSLLQLARMVDYLNRTFPPGTPLEDLDVDIIGAITGAPVNRFKRPVVGVWTLTPGEQIVGVNVVSPSPDRRDAEEGHANYKHFLEVWLDTLADEYEREAARSPIERGVLLGENRFLHTCFQRDGDGFKIGDVTANASPLFKVDLRAGVFDVGGSRVGNSISGSSVRSRATETITRWNAVEKQLSTLLTNQPNLPEKPLTAGDRKVVELLIDSWAKLHPLDELNLDFTKAANLLGLNEPQQTLLKASNATDLRGIARALRAAFTMERYNNDVRNLTGLQGTGHAEAVAPSDPIKFPLSTRESTAIRDTIAAHLNSHPNLELPKD